MTKAKNKSIGTSLSEIKGIVYLASPYSHDDVRVVKQRIEKLCRVDAKLMKQNIYTVSPLMKHFIIEYESLPGDWDFWQKYSQELLKHVSAVIVLMLPGWITSAGVKEEIIEAEELGLKVYYIDEELNCYYP